MPHGILNRNEKPIRVTLFHAEGCIHCDNFMPTWNEMNNDTEALKNIEFDEYEASAIGNLPEDVRTIDGADVRGFGYPTIKISFNNKEAMYSGRRTPEEIYKFILEVIKDTNEFSGKNVVVTKKNDGYDSHIAISTSDEDVEDSLRQMHADDMIGGEKTKKIFSKRITNEDFKFMNEKTHFSDFAKIK